MSIISSNIKFLRKKKGLTQQQFADQINIKRSLVGAYEEERAEPKYELLKVIAAFFRDQYRRFYKRRDQRKMAAKTKRQPAYPEYLCR